MLVFIAHSTATIYMTGLIWFVQLVHYPLHAHVGTGHFNEYQSLHVQWTGLAVGPMMLIEAISALLLVITPPSALPSWLLWLGFTLVCIIWGSTAFLQVPLHNSLQQGFDISTHKKLVLTNWIRTIAWSLRCLFTIIMMSLLISKNT